MRFNQRQSRQSQEQHVMYLAPLDAIWPPIALMAFAVIVGVISAWLEFMPFVVLAVLGFAILVGDIFGRSKDYLSARRRFVGARGEIETQEVIRRFRRAWCARVACSAAWKRARKSDADKSAMPIRYVSDAYIYMGYRWWHIFPDGTFTRNSPFIKIAFWVHLFTGKMKRDVVEDQNPGSEPAE